MVINSKLWHGGWRKSDKRVSMNSRVNHKAGDKTKTLYCIQVHRTNSEHQYIVLAIKMRDIPTNAY